MLHRVNKPDCLGDMKQLLKYQRRFLFLLLCHPSPLDNAVFKSWFGNSIGAWSRARVYRANNPTKKFGNSVEALVQFANSHRDEVKTVLLIIRHDHSFPVKRANTNFAFRFANLSSEWKAVLTPFLQGFYEFLHNKTGYPTKYFGFSRGNLSWHSFMDAQYETNKYVCPYCDDSPGDKTRKLDANDAEHWLPKSLYPHLSIHWANLFRACIPCNRTFKGDDNPIKHPGSRELEKTYHPYDKPALDTAHVSVEVKVSNPNTYLLKLQDTHNPICATEIDKVLYLSERWGEKIKIRLQGDKSALISDEIKRAGIRGIALTEDWLCETLLIESRLKNEKIGSRPNALLESCVLNFQKDHQMGELHAALRQAHQ